MFFYHPRARYQYEIPDSWLQVARAMSFVPSRPSYVVAEDLEWPHDFVNIQQIRLAEPHPDPSKFNFDATRMVTVLRAMVLQRPLPALQCSVDKGSGALILRDGFYRFHAAMALKFTEVPVTIRLHLELPR